jgi:hypothetical protein
MNRSMAWVNVARVRDRSKSPNRIVPASTNPSRTTGSDTTRHTADATNAGDFSGRHNPPDPNVSGTADDPNATTGNRWNIDSNNGTQNPS